MTAAAATAGRGSLRPSGIVGVAWGTVLLAQGDNLFNLVQGRPPSKGERIAILALGARHLIEGAAQIAVPHRFAGVHTGVDLIHGTSMLAVAAVRPGRRRAALTSAALALIAGWSAWRSR